MLYFVLSLKLFKKLIIASLEEVDLQGHFAYCILKSINLLYFATSFSKHKYNGFILGTNLLSLITPVVGPKRAEREGFPLNKFIIITWTSSSRLWPVTSLVFFSFLAA